MANGIEKQTFINADEHTKWAMTFDLLNSINDKLSAQLEVCDDRFKCLERSKTKTTVYATAGGFGGGIIAFISQWLLRR